MAVYCNYCELIYRRSYHNCPSCGGRLTQNDRPEEELLRMGYRYAEADRAERTDGQDDFYAQLNRQFERQKSGRAAEKPAVEKPAASEIAPEQPDFFARYDTPGAAEYQDPAADHIRRTGHSGAASPPGGQRTAACAADARLQNAERGLVSGFPHSAVCVRRPFSGVPVESALCNCCSCDGCADRIHAVHPDHSGDRVALPLHVPALSSPREDHAAVMIAAPKQKSRCARDQSRGSTVLSDTIV